MIRVGGWFERFALAAEFEDALAQGDLILSKDLVPLVHLAAFLIGGEGVKLHKVGNVDVRAFDEAEEVPVQGFAINVFRNGIGIMDGGHVRRGKRSVENGVKEVGFGEALIVAAKLRLAHSDAETVAETVQNFVVGVAFEPRVDLGELILGEFPEWFRNGELTSLHGKLRVES
jgi:hypothetical protein